MSDPKEKSGRTQFYMGSLSAECIAIPGFQPHNTHPPHPRRSCPGGCFLLPRDVDAELEEPTPMYTHTHTPLLLHIMSDVSTGKREGFFFVVPRCRHRSCVSIVCISLLFFSVVWFFCHHSSLLCSRGLCVGVGRGACFSMRFHPKASQITRETLARSLSAGFAAVISRSAGAPAIYAPSSRIFFFLVLCLAQKSEADYLRNFHVQPSQPPRHGEHKNIKTCHSSLGKRD